jgi:transforming growth factor-beta-induced protein
MRKLIALVASVFVLAMPLTTSAAQYDDNLTASSASDIVDTAVSDGRFTTLVAAVQAVGLVDVLKSDGPFTVFAPTDDAFAMLPAGTVESLLANPAVLTDILLYHVVSGAVPAADVIQLDTVQTVEGMPIWIMAGETGVMINSSNVLVTDVMASNGIIHVIDAVLLPPTN